MYSQTKILLVSTLLVGLVTSQIYVSQSAIAQAPPLWQVETVNTTEQCWIKRVSLAVSDEGVAHITYDDTYYNNTNDSAVIYSRRSDEGWVNEALDIGTVPGGGSLALDSLGYPHIAYPKAGKYGFFGAELGDQEHALMYARWDGTNWVVTKIGYNEFGIYNSIVLDDNDYAHISYLAGTEDGPQRPKYAFWNGSDWEISLIENVLTNHTSLALDSSGNTHVVYNKAISLGNGIQFQMRHAEYSNGQWRLETVAANESQRVGIDASIVVDDADQLHVGYGSYSTGMYYTNPSDLTYAKKTDGNWVSEGVNVPGEVGYSSLVLDAEGHPHISYYDAENQTINYAHWLGDSWGFSVVDTPVRMSQTVAAHTKITIGPNGQPHIAYCDEDNKAIKYAHPINPGDPVSTTSQVSEVRYNIYLPLVVK